MLADLLLHVGGEVLLLERRAAEHVLQVGLVLGAAVRRELVDDRLLAPLQLRAQLRVGEPEGRDEAVRRLRRLAHHQLLGEELVLLGGRGRGGGRRLRREHSLDLVLVAHAHADLGELRVVQVGEGLDRVDALDHQLVGELHRQGVTGEYIRVDRGGSAS